MLNFHEPQKIRKLQYLLKSKTVSGTAIKSILYDWALTLRVHPWSIGIMGQEQGVVTVPARMTITAALLPNIFKRNGVEKKGITGKEVGVPSRILRLDIGFKPNFVLRAVIVFEHRNLNFDSQNIKSHVQDVLIIQVSCYWPFHMLFLNNKTGGYPSLAIREFLNLLSEHRAMRDVPMFFFADYDVYGFDIYHVLKFGSRVTS